VHFSEQEFGNMGLVRCHTGSTMLHV
jgi:hypothetical protein